MRDWLELAGVALIVGGSLAVVLDVMRWLVELGRYWWTEGRW